MANFTQVLRMTCARSGGWYGCLPRPDASPLNTSQKGNLSSLSYWPSLPRQVRCTLQLFDVSYTGTVVDFTPDKMVFFYTGPYTTGLWLKWRIVPSLIPGFAHILSL